jgi:RNA 3'-terminal phosphate cyclase
VNKNLLTFLRRRVHPPRGGGAGDAVSPTITSADTASVEENALLAHVLTADEPVSWTITGGTDAADFEISTNVLRWLANGTQDYEVPSDSNFNNTYVVQVTATDGANNTANQSITVTVTDVAEGGIAPPTTRFNSAANSGLIAALEDF